MVRTRWNRGVRGPREILASWAVGAIASERTDDHTRSPSGDRLRRSLCADRSRTPGGQEEFDHGEGLTPSAGSRPDLRGPRGGPPGVGRPSRTKRRWESHVRRSEIGRGSPCQSRGSGAPGYLRDRRAVRPLLRVLEDQDPRIRSEAIFALGHLPDRVRARLQQPQGPRVRAVRLRDRAGRHPIQPAPPARCPGEPSGINCRNLGGRWWSVRRAISGNAPRHCWQSRRLRQPESRKLLMDKGGPGFESTLSSHSVSR